MTTLEETFAESFFPALEGVGAAEDLVVEMGGGKPLRVRGVVTLPGESVDEGADASFTVAMGRAVLPGSCGAIARGDKITRHKSDDDLTWTVEQVLARNAAVVSVALKVSGMRDLYNQTDRAVRRGRGRGGQ